jgi:hypothetical protein
MGKIEQYRDLLRGKADWKAFLLEESGLPGRRANIELAHAVADEGDKKRFITYLSYTPDIAPTNSPEEFVAFCGVLGLGKLLTEGQQRFMTELRQYASDPRWRIREAVAFALQRFGAQEPEALLREMGIWGAGNLLERRAVVAALCHPDLLTDESYVVKVLELLNSITAMILEVDDRRSPDFKALRKGLGYGWSVVAAALPSEGKAMMERWFNSEDADILWIMKSNLRKKRLSRIDELWVKRWLDVLVE